MTLMFVLVFVVMGLVSYNNLIIENTPQVDLPLVSIKTVYFGASPEEIETQIIKKIEDAVAEISQIKKVKSWSYENYGLVMIEFEVGADVNVKSIEVKDKVDPILNTLPKGAEKPEIGKFDPLIQPILDLVLLYQAGDGDQRRLFEYADKNLKDRLTVIEGVASVSIFGGKQRQINVDLDPLLMQKHFVAVNDVTDAVSSRNVNMPGGTIDRVSDTSSVRMTGEFETVEDLAHMTLVTAEGNAISLSDIAEVTDGHKKIETYTRFNGQMAVGLSIKKLSDGDAVNIVRRVVRLLPGIQQSLPNDMRLDIAFDATKIILSDTRTTVVNIVFGIFLTITILLLFLGNPRVTIVAGVVIPTSLISTLFPMDLSGFSINFLTLLAVATCLGTLIANALVVIESIELQLSKGLDSVSAAVKGTQEAGVAVFAAAGTNVVVFTPIAFMGGIVGQFMEQFGLTVVYATLFSLVASFTLTPMMCALLLKPERPGRKKNVVDYITHLPSKILGWMIREYRFWFDKIFAHHILTVLLCACLFWGAGQLTQYIGNEFVPPSDQDRVLVGIECPQGTLLEQTLEVAKEMESVIRTDAEVLSCLSYIGDGGAEKAVMTVNLTPASERQKSDLDLINQWIKEAAKIPDAEVSFARGEQGLEGEGDITVNVFGPDYTVMTGLSEQMKKSMLESGFFRSVSSSHKPPKQEIRFIPDENSMTRFGVKNQDVGDVIRTAVTGNDNNIFKEKGEEYDIRIRVDERHVSTLKDIAALPVKSRNGLVALGSLGRVVLRPGFSTLRRRDKKRVIQLDAYLSKSTAGHARNFLDGVFQPVFAAHPSYGYQYVGNTENEQESNQELGKAFMLAIILTYMLLTAIMNSFLKPLAIVSSIATSFVGVFVLLFFLGFSMNIGSMMSMVMLVGLAVNNAILLLDYAEKRLKQGDDIKDALWQGASVKFRAIVMTSLAIVFGALPQVFDKFIAKASIGGVIVGGVLASVFFSFVLVPVLFWYIHRITHKFRQIFS